MGTGNGIVARRDFGRLIEYRVELGSNAAFAVRLLELFYPSPSLDFLILWLLRSSSRPSSLTSMASTPVSLPIIDISAFLEPNATPAARDEVASALWIACVDYGFFYLIGHGISQSTTGNILSLARSFLQSATKEEKVALQRKSVAEGGDGARGYQLMGENVTGGLQDWHEAIDWYGEWGAAHEKELPGQDGTLTGKNKWPRRPDLFQATYEAYVQEMRKVGTAVVKAMGYSIAQALAREGQPDVDKDVFAHRSRDSFWVMRMIGYPPLPNNGGKRAPDGDPEQFSCGTHTDYGCVTLLLTDDTPRALQVQLKDGSWIYANPIAGAYVVNIGDFMEKWTGGRWKSTKHRVIHRGDSYRVSVPFFFEPSWDAPETEVGKEPAEGEHVVTYGQHLLGKVKTNFY